VAVVAAEEPLTAANNALAAILTWTRRPGKEFIQGDRPLNRFSEILLRKRISPIRINSGRAIIVELLVLFHRILERMVRGGLLVKSVNPAIPTMNRVIPTHTLLPNNSIRRPSTVKDITNKLKVVSP
jgi:hypothetical protein